MDISDLDYFGIAYYGAIIVISVFLIIAVIASAIVPLMNQSVIEGTVLEKVPYHNGKYLVTVQINDQREVFSVSDVWLMGIFDSSDRYANLDTNAVYRFHVGGYRIPILSWYRNINSVER